MRLKALAKERVMLSNDVVEARRSALSAKWKVKYIAKELAFCEERDMGIKGCR